MQKKRSGKNRPDHEVRKGTKKLRKISNLRINGSYSSQCDKSSVNSKSIEIYVKLNEIDNPSIKLSSVDVKSVQDGFRYIGFRCRVAVSRHKSFKSKSSNSPDAFNWIEGIIKYWDPKFRMFFIHFFIAPNSNKYPYPISKDKICADSHGWKYLITSENSPPACAQIDELVLSPYSIDRGWFEPNPITLKYYETSPIFTKAMEKSLNNNSLDLSNIHSDCFICNSKCDKEDSELVTLNSEKYNNKLHFDSVKSESIGLKDVHNKLNFIEENTSNPIYSNYKFNNFDNLNFEFLLENTKEKANTSNNILNNSLQIPSCYKCNFKLHKNCINEQNIYEDIRNPNKKTLIPFCNRTKKSLLKEAEFHRNYIRERRWLWKQFIMTKKSDSHNNVNKLNRTIKRRGSNINYMGIGSKNPLLEGQLPYDLVDVDEMEKMLPPEVTKVIIDNYMVSHTTIRKLLMKLPNKMGQLIADHQVKLFCRTYRYKKRSKLSPLVLENIDNRMKCEKEDISDEVNLEKIEKRKYNMFSDVYAKEKNGKSKDSDDEIDRTEGNEDALNETENLDDGIINAINSNLLRDSRNNEGNLQDSVFYQDYSKRVESSLLTNESSLISENLPNLCNNNSTISLSTLHKGNTRVSDYIYRDECTHPSEDMLQYICSDCLECIYCKEPLKNIPQLLKSTELPNRSILYKQIPIRMENYVLCNTCHVGFHGSCSNPFIPPLITEKKYFRCSTCCYCSHCGYRDHNFMDYAAWDTTFTSCIRCCRGFEKGQYCAICRQIWSSSWDGDWLQCDTCRFWIHTNCDTNLPNSIEVLKSPSVSYHCPACRSNEKKPKYQKILDHLFCIDKHKDFYVVPPSSYQNYWKVVKIPMDFITIAERIKNDYYTDAKEYEFLRDILRIIHNAQISHMPNHRIFKLASNLLKKCVSLYQILFGNTTLKQIFSDLSKSETDTTLLTLLKSSDINLPIEDSNQIISDIQILNNKLILNTSSDISSKAANSNRASFKNESTEILNDTEYEYLKILEDLCNKIRFIDPNIEMRISKMKPDIIQCNEELLILDNFTSKTIKCQNLNKKKSYLELIQDNQIINKSLNFQYDYSNDIFSKLSQKGIEIFFPKNQKCTKCNLKFEKLIYCDKCSEGIHWECAGGEYYNELSSGICTYSCNSCNMCCICNKIASEEPILKCSSCNKLAHYSCIWINKRKSLRGTNSGDESKANKSKENDYICLWSVISCPGGSDISTALIHTPISAINEEGYYQYVTDAWYMCNYCIMNRKNYNQNFNVQLVRSRMEYIYFKDKYFEYFQNILKDIQNTTDYKRYFKDLKIFDYLVNIDFGEFQFPINQGNVLICDLCSRPVLATQHNDLADLCFNNQLCTLNLPYICSYCKNTLSIKTNNSEFPVALSSLLSTVQYRNILTEDIRIITRTLLEPCVNAILNTVANNLNVFKLNAFLNKVDDSTLQSCMNSIFPKYFDSPFFEELICSTKTPFIEWYTYYVGSGRIETFAIKIDYLRYLIPGLPVTTIPNHLFKKIISNIEAVVLQNKDIKKSNIKCDYESNQEYTNQLWHPNCKQQVDFLNNYVKILLNIYGANSNFNYDHFITSIMLEARIDIGMILAIMSSFRKFLLNQNQLKVQNTQDLSKNLLFNKNGTNSTNLGLYNNSNAQISSCNNNKIKDVISTGIKFMSNYMESLDILHFGIGQSEYTTNEEYSKLNHGNMLLVNESSSLLVSLYSLLFISTTKKYQVDSEMKNIQICFFCKLSTENYILGPMIKFLDSYFLHKECILWSLPFILEPILNSVGIGYESYFDVSNDVHKTPLINGDHPSTSPNIKKWHRTFGITNWPLLSNPLHIQTNDLIVTINEMEILRCCICKELGATIKCSGNDSCVAYFHLICILQNSNYTLQETKYLYEASQVRISDIDTRHSNIYCDNLSKEEVRSENYIGNFISKNDSKFININNNEDLQSPQKKENFANSLDKFVMRAIPRIKYRRVWCQQCWSQYRHIVEPVRISDYILSNSKDQNNHLQNNYIVPTEFYYNTTEGLSGGIWYALARLLSVHVKILEPRNYCETKDFEHLYPFLYNEAQINIQLKLTIDEQESNLIHSVLYKFIKYINMILYKRKKGILQENSNFELLAEMIRNISEYNLKKRIYLDPKNSNHLKIFEGSAYGIQVNPNLLLVSLGKITNKLNIGKYSYFMSGYQAIRTWYMPKLLSKKFGNEKMTQFLLSISDQFSSKNLNENRRLIFSIEWLPDPSFWGLINNSLEIDKKYSRIEENKDYSRYIFEIKPKTAKGIEIENSSFISNNENIIKLMKIPLIYGSNINEVYNNFLKFSTMDNTENLSNIKLSEIAQDLIFNMEDKYKNSNFRSNLSNCEQNIYSLDDKSLENSINNSTNIESKDALTFFGLNEKFVNDLVPPLLYKYYMNELILNSPANIVNPYLWSNHRVNHVNSNIDFEEVSASLDEKYNPLALGEVEHNGEKICEDSYSILLLQTSLNNDSDIILNNNTFKHSNILNISNRISRRRTKAEDMTPAMAYRYLESLTPDKRLDVKKSKIHGYGLFAKEFIYPNEPIVEYVGEVIRNSVADKREKIYEQEGQRDGSCYMFRLDEHRVIDATNCGNLARFMNHCCQPNCVCKVITSDDGNKHIVIFSKTEIKPDEEVTYDYQFNLEEESEKIYCYCGAPNCLGRMN
ncbi:SET domain-containing protein [Cryptosporidium serpentis]